MAADRLPGRGKDTAAVCRELGVSEAMDAKRIIEMFTALVGLLTALLMLYISQHPAAPVTPQQVVQFFDQSQHVVNQTTIVNPPPAPGAG